MHEQDVAADDHEAAAGLSEVQRQKALFKTGALQDAIFNSANFSSIATDEKGVIQIFNVGAERMLGYAAADVVDRITLADISDPQEVIARASALSVELATPISPGFEALVFKASRGIEDIYELTYIRKDGSRFPAVVSVTALRDAANAIIGYLLIGTDNTARKQVEAEQSKLDQRLRDQQFYTRSLIESNIDALVTTDPAGIITDVNKQMEALTGSTRDELIGSPFKKHFIDSDRAEAGIKLVLQEKTVNNYELTSRAHNARATVVSCNSTTFYDRDRNLKGVIVAARDVTERKRLDQSLQETNIQLENARFAAEKANLAKSDFLSSMSHELRSPLNAILGFAQLMVSGMPPPTAAQNDSIEQILKAGWYLLELINEILDLTLIESGQLSLSPESVSLVEVLEDCRAMIEPQGQRSGIAMKFPAPGNPFYVRADRTRVKQVFVNLLSNAVKYNRAGGSVEVRCEAVSAQRVRVGFHDTGMGLSEDKLAQLFQPFNRLGQAYGNEEGTGIGLVVSKRLVELMGGKIGVVSDIGKGSSFWFELPLFVSDTDWNVRNTLDQGIQDLSTYGLRILAADDNEANRRLVEFSLEEMGLRAEYAKDGVEVVEAWKNNEYDVILMDCQMPLMNGFDAARYIREQEEARNIPPSDRVRIIALTANALKGVQEQCFEAGMDAFLTKPFTVYQLNQALAAATRSADSSNNMSISSSSSEEIPKFSPTIPDQLATDLGAESAIMIVEDFLAELPDRLAELPAFASQGRWEELSRLAHSLQGMGLSVGLNGFGAKMKELEQLAPTGDKETVDALLTTIPDEAAQGVAELRGWISRLPKQIDS